jgi:hypothetical protein
LDVEMLKVWNITNSQSTNVQEAWLNLEHACTAMLRNSENGYTNLYFGINTLLPSRTDSKMKNWAYGLASNSRFTALLRILNHHYMYWRTFQI